LLIPELITCYQQLCYRIEATSLASSIHQPHWRTKKGTEYIPQGGSTAIWASWCVVWRGDDTETQSRKGYSPWIRSSQSRRV